MAVVAIIAVLSVTAFASHSRNVKQSRTAEAVMNLERMWQSAIAYFYTEHATADGEVLPAQFPSSAPVTPSGAPTAGKYEPDPSVWSHPTWDALNFSMSSPHNYQYGFYNRSDAEAPPGGGGPAFGDAGPFAGAGGPMGGGAFGGDSKAGTPDKDAAADKPMPSRKAQEQVAVCHIPPGNPSNAHTIVVGAPAVRAHLRHGDYVGNCSDVDGDDDDDDDPQQTDPDDDGGDDEDTDSGQQPTDPGDDGDDDEGEDDDSGQQSADPGDDDGDDEEEDDDSGQQPADPDDDDDEDDEDDQQQANAGDDDDGGDDDDDDDDPQQTDPGDDGDNDDPDDEDDPFADADGGEGPCAHLFGEDGNGTPGFYLYATGNLDGDQDYGYFYRSVNVDADCQMQAAPTVIHENPLE